MIEREACGGKMNVTNKIENYPGHQSVLGIDLSSEMLASVESLGAEIDYSEVVDSDLNGEVKYVFTKSKEFAAESVIVANGLKTRKLGCEGESEFTGHGVSYCAACDGFFFKGKNVVVVGGGNTALEDSLYLSEICAEVTLVVRKNELRAEQYLVDLVNQKANINISFGSRVKKIIGKKNIHTIELEVFDESLEVPIDGVFVAIGFEPENDAFNGIKKDEYGYFYSDESCKTNIPGVFVAGDCRKKQLRQIVTAAADGACASTSAVDYLRLKHSKQVPLGQVRKTRQKTLPQQI